MREKEKQPPSSNTGVENTERKGLSACVDWVQVTFKTDDIKYLVTKIFGLRLSNFTKEDKGQFGYRKTLRFGNIAIFYEGSVEMGVHVQMTGQGCREYELFGDKSWEELFRIVIEFKGKFTRVDIAIDDFKGYFKIPTLIRKIKNGELVSKFKTIRRMETIEIADGSSKGNTLYYGSPQSEIQIRMYEKKHEMEGKGLEVSPDIEFWNRTEIQARNTRAEQIANLLAFNEFDNEPIGEIVRGILKNYISYRLKGEDLNKSRWKVAPFWNTFLGEVEKLRLTKVPPERTVQKTFRWVDKQVSKSLAILYEATGGDMKIFEEFIENGLDRMGKKERDMIDRFFASNPAYKVIAEGTKKENRIKKDSQERVNKK